MADAPTASGHADSGYVEHPLRSSAVRQETRRSRDLFSTPAPASFRCGLPWLSIRGRSMLFGFVRPESPCTSDCGALIGGQRTDLHHRRRVLNVNQRFALLPCAQWNVTMVLRRGDHRMLPRSLAVNRDPVAAVMHFDFTPALAQPHLFARIRPRHRVAAALPGNIGIPRDFAKFVIDVGIR